MEVILWSSWLSCLLCVYAIFAAAQENVHSVRLVGPTAYIGQVQVIYNGQWSSICHSDWTIVDASVVCSQLGYGRHALSAKSLNYAAESRRGRVGQAISGFHCRGYEARLDMCELLGDTIRAGPVMRDRCNHRYAGVICQTPTQRSQHPVRLVNGSAPNEGRVEIKQSGDWTTVCDYGWGKPEADIVCRQIGYSRAIRTRNAAYFGEGEGTILLSNVSCRPDDLSFRHDVRYCDDTDWYPSLQECSHKNDAGVECDTRGSSREIRLAGPKNEAVQIKFNEDWVSICDENWNIHDAHVVCRQLGYKYAVEAPRTTYHGSSNGYYLRNFLCDGNEARLDMCKPRGAWNLGRCASFYFAGVICLPADDGSYNGLAHTGLPKTSVILPIIVVAIAAIVIPAVVYIIRLRRENRTRQTRAVNGGMNTVPPLAEGTVMTPITSVGFGRYVTSKENVTLVDDVDFDVID